MSMQRVIVIGCPGAGKSTFSKALHSKTELPLIHLDMIWHKADGSHIEREEFDKKLCGILKRDKWIIDGNYSRTLEIRLKACDTVFLLDFSSDICLEGARERLGKAREDMPWVERELNSDFLNYIGSFAELQIPIIYSLLEKYKGKNKQVIVFNSRRQMKEYLDNF